MRPFNSGMLFKIIYATFRILLILIVLLLLVAAIYGHYNTVICGLVALFGILMIDGFLTSAVIKEERKINRQAKEVNQ